jgi:hypothetical protein
MGLSIHYSGHIRQYAFVDELLAEVTDICENLDWTYHILDGNNTDKLKGICFSPEGCEPIFLTFLLNGRMCSPVNLMHRDIYEENELERELLYTTSTKTQYAGPDAHIAIIKLLRYLKEKYFSVFELNDEGMYWETMDEKVLLGQFAKYEFLLTAVTEALSNMKVVPGETALSLADRIEEMLKKKFQND